MRSWLRVGAGALVVGVVTAGCQWPRDVDGTLERVRGGTLRVGVVEAEPWAAAAEGPRGVEVRLVEELAGRVGAEVSWVPGATAELVSGLHDGALDLVVGGLTAQDPWTAEVTFTRPYVTTRTVVAVPGGEPAPEDVAGRTVRLEADPQLEGLLRSAGAVPQVVPDAGGGTGPVAVEDWELDLHGLRGTGVELQSADHVWAVRSGESGWQVEVERFLLRLDPAHVQRLLDEEGA
ncbi:transporter substrate-binding domain-containing protein [Kineococcus glutinatus]|uniref:Solute-binding protein family 3/N-terminal domain-containing protein n=1 Tax=Kineococcus glutinatus TaxID=1070872 RepID=A0ABP9I294_9ACTN